MNETIKNILPARKEQLYKHPEKNPSYFYQTEGYNYAIDHCAAAIERAVKEGKIIITDNESCCCNKDKPFLKEER